jgi:hypothetical protein
MPHPLKHLLTTVRRRARLALLGYGLAWVLVVAVVAGLLLGLFDWALRSDDLVVRVLCCGLWWLAVVGAVYRFLVPAMAVRLSDVRLAQRIERRWPELGDGLSSAVEFVDQAESDVLAGSPDLRRTAIADAEARVAQYRLPRVLDYRWPIGMSAVAAGATVLLIVAFWAAPASTSLAAWRLFLPMTARSWPRVHHLEFIDPPHKIASGEDFSVELFDRNGDLPDEVEILFRPVMDDGVVPERQPMEYDFARERMIYRLKNVSQPFDYRAIGGDDDTMDWIRLDVVQPPRIDSVDITLHPPAYTGWPSEPSDRNIRALAGTRVEVRGKTTKPLAGAAVVIETGTGEEPLRLPARLGDDATAFFVPADAAEPWLIDESGVYGFELIDPNQYRQAERSRWELRAVADRPPTISLERPATNIYVTADAVVRIRALVKDDLAVQSIDLVFLPSNDEEKVPQRIEVHRGPEKTPRVDRSPLAAGGLPGDSVSVDYQWDLGSLGDLSPGDSIDFHLIAADYQPQENTCTSRRLTIISAEELVERIAQRQTFILGQLAEAIEAQQDARSQTRALTIELDEVGHLDPQDINHLQSAELNQRNVERLLVDDREGLTVQVQDMLADLVSNRVDSPDMFRRMEGLLSEIRRIGKDHLPFIRQQLVAALKTSQAGRDGPDSERSTEMKNLLAGAGSHQDRVVDALEQLRSQLAKWDSYRRFAREVSQLRRDQQSLTDETAEHGLSIVGRDLQDLDAADRSRLRRFAERQLELARQLERILGRMEQMQLQLADAEPLAAETIGDAVDVARRQAIAERMRGAGRDIEANRLGQAAQAHAAIDESLEDMLDLLAGRRSHELSRMIRNLRQRAFEVQEAAKKIKGLSKKLRNTNEDPQLSEAEKREQFKRLMGQRQQMQEELDRLARQLKRLQAQAAGECVGRAGRKMGAACDAGQRGDRQSALEQTGGAQKDLENAEGHLKKRLEQLQRDLLQEQLERLEQHVQALRKQQEAILEETQRLRQIEVQQQRLTRGQAESVSDLASQQRALADEARAFAESIAQALVFHAALGGAADDMNRTAARLARRLLDDTTQQLQQETIARLNDLLEALKPEPPREDGEDPDGGGAGIGDGPEQGGGGSRITNMAELKLLMKLQQQLLRRTAALEQDRQRRGGVLTDDALAELIELSQEQGRLAEITLEISEPADEPPEDNPENLPDVREEDPIDLDAELERSLRESVPGFEE